MVRNIPGVVGLIFSFALWGWVSPSTQGAEYEAAPGKKAGTKKDKRRKGKKKKRSSKDLDASPLPSDAEAEAKVQKELGEAFSLLRTKHYSIFYNTDEADVGAFSAAIERTYRSCLKYTSKLGIESKRPKKKLISHFFNEFEDYADHSEKHLGMGRPAATQLGFFLYRTNHTYFYNYRNTPAFKKMRDDAEKKLQELGEQARRGNLNPGRRRQLDLQMREARWILNRTDGLGGGQTEETLQHEVSHQVLYNIGFHSRKGMTNPFLNPRWFVEGTAQIFEPISDGKAANFGQLNKGRLENYQGLVRSGHLIPLRHFISDMRYFGRSDAGGLAYPQSWALVHYLNKVKRKQLKKYVRLILDRPADYKSTPEKEISDFEAAFGKLDKKWEQRWIRWMKDVR